MPRLDTARVVNVHYNGKENSGKRAIIDQSFKFHSKNAKEAVNVLINMENGVGKSVLTQFMLQPIIPKAEVQGRKLIDYIDTPAHHVYVVQEWHKDGSDERFLIGISMTHRNSETSRKIRFYTFCTSYPKEGSRYDIRHLQLSSLVDGRFVPAEYNYVRDLAKESNGELVCYDEDSMRDWYQLLEEYGINKNEWKTIANINLSEGGITKFFEPIKTSDAMANTFIDKAEEKLSYGSEDNNPETLMIDAIRQYINQNEYIRGRQILEGLGDDFKRRIDEAMKIKAASADAAEAQANLCGFYEAVQERIRQCREDETRLESEVEDADNVMRDIKYEKMSREYYVAKDTYDDAQTERDAAERERDEISSELKETRRQIVLQECASYNTKLAVVEREIDATRAAISDVENNSDGSRRLAVLKFSAFTALKTALEKESNRLAECKALLVKAEAGDHDADEILRIVKRKEADARRALDRISGELDAARREILKAADRGGFELTQRLDGGYSKEEIDDLKKRREKDYQVHLSKSAALRADIKELETDRSCLPQKIADVEFKKASDEAAIKSAETALNEYEATRRAVLGICEQYDWNESDIYDGGAVRLLEGLEQQERAESAALSYDIKVAQKAVAAAEHASVHVPIEIIEYLNRTGVRYQTCEQYLLTQIENGTLTAERCAEILKSMPVLAFGVLMDGSEQKRLLSDERADWLPATVPLFTPTQMKRALEMNSDSYDAIAFYSEAYFANKASYLEETRAKLRQLQDTQSQYDSKLAEMRSQIGIARQFTYSSDWYAKTIAALESLRNSIAQYEQQAAELREKGAALTNRISALESDIQTEESEIRAYELFCDRIRELEERIDAEIALTDQCSDASNSYRDAHAALENAEVRKQAAYDNYVETARTVKDTAANIEAMQTGLSDVQDCVETDLIDDSWENLLGQYRECLRAQGSELKSLRDMLEEKERRAGEYRNELERRAIDRKEYEDLRYSEEKETELRKAETILSDRSDESADRYESASEALGQAKGRLDGAQNAILEYAEDPLPRHQIGSDFDGRIRREKERKRSCEMERRAKTAERERFDKVADRLCDKLPEELRSAHRVELEQDCEAQCKRVLSELKDRDNLLKQLIETIRQGFDDMCNQCRGTLTYVADGINCCKRVLNDATGGEVSYDSLVEQVGTMADCVDRYALSMRKELEDYDLRISNLISICYQRGRDLHRELQCIARASRVVLGPNQPARQMIKIDIPEQVDPVIARQAMADEIQRIIEELAKRSKDDPDYALSDGVHNALASKKLLRQYIGQSSITVRVWTIDQVASASHYRTWEDAGKQDSGAQGFVSQFAVIETMIRYARSVSSEFIDNSSSGVIIMDNPFGAITSSEYLEPLFAIARQFDVQMICLSCINTKTVLDCFDSVIRCSLRHSSSGNIECLCQNDSYELSQGQMREQISMF